MRGELAWQSFGFFDDREPAECFGLQNVKKEGPKKFSAFPRDYFDYCTARVILMATTAGLLCKA